MSILLQLNRISIGRRHTLVGEINSEIFAGQLVVLTGNNGSGKSTLLKTIAGLIPVVKGEIHIQSKPLKSLNRAHLSAMLSFAGTERAKEDYITVEDMVRFGRYPYATTQTAEHSDKAVQEAMEQMGISNLSNKYLDQISDGEWQKANIARVLAQETDLILMDEPAAFLDYPSRIRLFKDLSIICSSGKRSIIVSTHDIETANQYGNVFWHIQDGQFSESAQPPVWKL